MNDQPQAEPRTQKIALLHRVQQELQSWQSGESEEARVISPLETAMRIVVGITFLVIGLVAVVLVGGPKLFSKSDVEVAVATFLVFGGMVAALSGASLVKFYYGSSIMTGRVLFGLCFVVATALMVTGLILAFSSITISMYLLVIGFLAAIISALALK